MTDARFALPRSPVRSSMSEAGSKNPQEQAKAEAKAAKANKRREVNAGTAVQVGERQTAKDYVPRFKKRYNDSIRTDLMKKFGYTNAMQVPRINKVVLNIGAGEAASDSKKIQQALNDLTAIAGQKAVVTRAKKAIATFKIREGLAIGAKVTLRGDVMYEFIDRLITMALPRVRDFRGVNTKSFDGRGNYAMGLKEQLVFPEVDYDKIDAVRGMDIVICTTAKTDPEAKALLKGFQMPFIN